MTLLTNWNNECFYVDCCFLQVEEAERDEIAEQADVKNEFVDPVSSVIRCIDHFIEKFIW